MVQTDRDVQPQPEAPEEELPVAEVPEHRRFQQAAQREHWNEAAALRQLAEEVRGMRHLSCGWRVRTTPPLGCLPDMACLGARRRVRRLGIGAAFQQKMLCFAHCTVSSSGRPRLSRAP